MRIESRKIRPLVPCTLVGLAIGYFTPMGRNWPSKFEWWYVDRLQIVGTWIVTGVLLGICLDLWLRSRDK